MKASTERKLIRLLHMLLAVPIVGYFYGGMSNIEWMTDAIRFYFLPLIAFSGLWLWKGNLIKRRLYKNGPAPRKGN